MIDQKSEVKDGPNFEYEHCSSGSFSSDNPKFVVKLTVASKKNVYIQTLLDCNIAYAKDEQFLSVNLLDVDGEYLYPRLPNDYKPATASNYSHNG